MHTHSHTQPVKTMPRPSWSGCRAAAQKKRHLWPCEVSPQASGPYSGFYRQRQGFFAKGQGHAVFGICVCQSFPSPRPDRQGPRPPRQPRLPCHGANTVGAGLVPAQGDHRQGRPYVDVSGFCFFPPGGNRELHASGISGFRLDTTPLAVVYDGARSCL
jgi:hypothetical protein